jgi:N-acetylglucosaminyldiphosphoundecaprenol N-acetyl-beta-D-mannosaminyltransferase
MNPDNGMETVSVMGVPITCFRSYEHAVECIVGRIKAGERTSCFAVGPEKICFARADRSLLDVIRQADIHCCDGVGAALAARLLHGHSVPRITGVQLFHELLAAAQTEALRVFVLGARPRSNEVACARLSEQYPRLQLVGRHDGYFDDDQPVIEQVNAARPDMLFVAMGSPKQEIWIAKHRDAIAAPYCMGIGGTLDVVSGQAKWAPGFVRRTGTEFLYRLVMEPRRWRRYGIVPKFACHILREMAFAHRPQNEPLT